MGLAFLIIGDKLQLLSERKVLKEHEYAALLDAAGLVQAARGEAADIVAAARAQAQQSLQKGYDEGWEAARAAHALQSITSALQAQSQLRALREAMARLVVQGVEQITSELPAASLLESALERVDTMLRLESFILLRVAPGEETHARQALARLGARVNWASVAQVQADPELREGYCVVQTASGSMDIGLEAQLATIARALQGMGAAAH
jgi:type III secretion protein L